MNSSLRLFVASFILLPAAMSLGAPIIDQSTLKATYTGGWAISNGRELAQLVTVGVSGTLDRVDLSLVRNAGAPGDVELRIRRTVNGVPTPESTAADILLVLSGSSLPSAVNGAIPITSVDLSNMGFMVSAGEQIAITVELTAVGGGSPPWTLFADGTNIPGAKFDYGYFGEWKTSTGAVGVQTWVETPEPATLSLLTLGGLVMLRRKQVFAVK